MLKIELSQSDQIALEKVLSGIGPENLPEKTLHGLINDWIRLIDEIERGYQFTIYDYTNDLSIRDFLEKIKTILSNDGQTKISELIKPIDEKFLAVTRVVNRPLLESLNDEHQPFWWYRIPKRLEGDLEQDLHNEGFL